MPRSVGQSIPKYRKHRATGQAVCTINGRDYYLGPHGTKASRIVYDRIICEWLENGRHPPGTNSEELTLAELLSRYWKYAKSYYLKDGKCTGQIPKIKSALKVVKQRYGRTMAVDFGPLALRACRRQWVEDGHSRNYVNEHAARVVRVFRWAASEQLVPASVPQALAMVPGLRKGHSEAPETAPIQPVGDAAVEETLLHLPGVVADMVRLQRLTGCRPAEVCILRPCDLDRSGDVWTYQPESHKTEHHGRERVIFIGPKAQEVLLRYLARDSQAYCFRPCDSEEKRLAENEANRKTPQSCGNVRGSNAKKKPKRKPGEQYTTDSYRRAIHRACDRAFPAPDGTEGDDLRKWQSGRRWSPNQLRHAAATEVRREFGLEAAQVILGHSQANVTQVYAERDMAKGLEVAAKIG